MDSGKRNKLKLSAWKRRSVGLLFIVALFYILLYAHGCIVRSRCSRQLQSIGCLIYHFREINHGRSPLSLQECLAFFEFPEHYILACPGRRDTNGHHYTYLSLGIADSTSMELHPIAYDSNFRNHKGKGVMVLLSNGTTLWDREGRWLVAYAIRHPERDVHLPFGLNENNNPSKANGASP